MDHNKVLQDFDKYVLMQRQDEFWNNLSYLAILTF